MERWIEKRQHVRQQVSISGTAASAGGLLHIPVLITNLSRSGAMVEIPSGEHLPDEIILLFTHSFEPCRKIWHEGVHAGFVFTDI
jgi:hypothetical protein